MSKCFSELQGLKIKSKFDNLQLEKYRIKVNMSNSKNASKRSVKAREDRPRPLLPDCEGLTPETRPLV